MSDKKICHLGLVSFIMSIAGFILGMEITSLAVFLTSEYFNQYFNNPSPFQQGILMASSTFGGLFGCIIYTLIVAKCGRVTLFHLGSILWFIGSIVGIFVYNIWMIAASRFIKGITIGIFSILIPAYISELYPAKKKGRVMGYTQLACTLSTLIIHYLCVGLNELGNDVSFRAAWGFEILPVLLFFGLTFWLPETPQWLTLHGDYTKAQIIQNNVATSYNSRHNEVNHIDLLHKIDLAGIYGDGSNDLKYMDLFKKPYWKQTLFGTILQLLVQFSGINILLFYITYICEMIGLKGEEKFVCASIPYFINTGLSLFPIMYMDHVKRKISTLFGAFPLSLIMIAIGVIMAVFGHSVKPIDGNKSIVWFIEGKPGLWILGLCLLFVVIFALTLSCMPTIFTSEIFELKSRPKGMAFCISAGWLLNCILTLLAPLMMEYLKWGTFILLGGVTFVVSIIISIYGKETYNLSEKQISSLFDKNKRGSFTGSSDDNKSTSTNENTTMSISIKSKENPASQPIILQKYSGSSFSV
ncbi:uncharacterized protein NDAI_0G01750 [Naumovozyma dairenensis CBS 421]|uniref:Major facilitator superfamily (MFS) profile domain-containing protein n=1 Tax=Naumovozyma dairenensis (strain ATCC 10597 / BCRC 20456 / CBS 421 / NBRC 0211 / NRRL Y-12639) TaxID=1071378 RepID=G0WDU0_NAUDC|nr:hypothetical protein NDAI_0G01750 [Naumovozyma dairenensis CBS 421]CCD25951.2 hypothetical protein NDAI_0G01750 [Naumovozyma dairenensis CBS 421]